MRTGKIRSPGFLACLAPGSTNTRIVNLISKIQLSLAGYLLKSENGFYYERLLETLLIWVLEAECLVPKGVGRPTGLVSYVRSRLQTYSDVQKPLRPEFGGYRATSTMDAKSKMCFDIFSSY